VAYWLIKSEPSAYSYARLETDGRTAWTGVRNFEARNNLRAMKKGDRCLFYHSVDEKAVVGVARVLGAAYADPTAKGEDWACVDVAPDRKLDKPVTLAEIKARPVLSQMQLVKKSRLSVTPVTERDFELVVSLGSAKLR
jgi:predicted RNA-binding protein with PUA-like domain